jgi:hypothetical protein
VNTLEKIKTVLKSLKMRRIESAYFDSKEELIEALKSEVQSSDLIGFGGSMTVDQLGLYDLFATQGNEVLWHWKTAPEDRLNVMRRALFSDVYFASANAITEDGKIINIDGNGNRVAPMFFGPKKTILICGINKIASDYDSAMDRIKTIACPQNARRLGKTTPCSKTDFCADCKKEERMCTVTTIIEQKPTFVDLKVYFVNEELGY